MNHFEEAMKKRAARYGEIKHLRPRIEFTITPGYAHFQYTGKTTDPEASALSAADVALLADHGNLCFGCRSVGKYERNGVTTFTGTVHTD